MQDNETERKLHPMCHPVPAYWLALAVAALVAVAAWGGSTRGVAPTQAERLQAAASPPAMRDVAEIAPALNVLPSAEDAAAYADAKALFRAGRWAGAYGRFSALADGADGDAARIALFMLRYGDELFDTRWSASEEQIGAWVHAAARAPELRDFSGGD